jgi:FAD/FMN-containing dehydrogenase
MTAITTLPRRRFLQAAAAFSVAGALDLQTPAFAKPAIHSFRNLEALRRDFHGRLILPGEMGYLMAAFPNNARYANILPEVIAVCASDEDIQRCIHWAGQTGLPFAIRSGGHNYAGFSTTRGLLIDVKWMNKVRPDLDRGTVTIQCGANNQNMADVLNSTNFAVPSGRCPTVGASGLVLGGGWGFSATHAGLTCDSLVGTDIVLADGSKVTASDSENDALFWALRGGGGGNFGVNTSFTFRLHDVGDPVTIFNIVWPGEQQIRMLDTLQHIQNDNARQISTRTKAFPDSPGANPRLEQLRVTTLGQFFGPIEDARKALSPALDLVAPLKQDIRQMSYWQARDYLITDDPNGMYDLRSSYVAEALSPEGIETMLRWMTRWPGGSLVQENMGILFASGGAVRDKTPDDTAYVHRNANYIFEMEASWSPLDTPEIVARQQEWLTAYFSDMQRFLLPQSYVNFPNRDLPDWDHAYYGSNLPRLRDIKHKYDPCNLFRFEQSIPPAGGVPHPCRLNG